MSEALVTVKFFASLREVVGAAQMQVRASNVAQLKTNLAGLLSAESMAELLAENVRIAVNQELVSSDATPLANDDEVAFLPPVTGG